MKLLFIHDNSFKKYKKNVYTGGQLTYEMFSNKYLQLFNNVVIASRSEEVSEQKKIRNMSVVTGENIKHIRLPNINNFFKLQKEIRKQLKQTDALTVRLPGIYSLLAIKEARKLNKPYFIEVVGNTYKAYWYHGKKTGKIMAPISQYLMKKEVKKAKYIIYVTQNYLQEVYPPNKNAITTKISNVELTYVSEDILKIRNKKINNYNESTNYKIGLIGTYSAKYKGIDTAIEALSKIKEINVDLHILGSGNNLWLKELAKKHQVVDRVYFDGIRQSGREVMEWIDDKDIYIHPSFTEGLPRALIEAMSRGLPCVASNVGGIPELIESQFLHEPKDSGKLKVILYELLLNKEKLTKASKTNFQKAQEYNQDILSNKRQEFIKNFIEKEEL